MHDLASAKLVWLIPLLPLAGFFFHAFLGRWCVRTFGEAAGKKVVGGIATLVVFVAFAVSVVIFKDLLAQDAEGRRAIGSLIPGGRDVPWIEIGTFKVYYRALIDPLSILMCLIVTGVGGLIHLYATGYMADDRDYPRFFTYLNLFIFFMLMLVLGENILLMFVGWEGVGLCSYLLISFWFEDVENSKAGNKAFIVNRIGDVGFGLGIMAIFATFGTLSFYSPGGNGFLDQALKGVTEHGALTAATAGLIGILLFIGATGKSAQFPLYVWLPDAMAGPTPVSALIHAATMVTAGVVMISRVSPIIVHSPAVMTTIAVVGIFTAFFAASIGMTQNDIKKVLAYSTVSQLGYMFLGCGVGAFSAGMFHVTTHAFFKALLFLGAGSVIHALAGEQDMRKMGGLAKKIPITYWTMAMGWLAICGIFPFAGFWSKDEILGAASGYPDGGKLLYLVGVITAAMTAFYMSRLMWKTFWTAQRYNEAELGAHGHGTHSSHAATSYGHEPEETHEDEAAHPADGHGDTHHHVHESPPSMWVPLAVLAALSVVGGLMGIPNELMKGGNRFEAFLESAVAHTELHEGLSVGAGMGIGFGAGLLGIIVAYMIYSRRRTTGDFAPEEVKLRNPLYTGSLNLWYVDWAFTRVAVGWGGAVANAVWIGIDRFIIDGIVNMTATLAAFFSEVFRQVQTGYVRNYALMMLLGVVAVLGGILAGAHHLLAK